jgi:hypothetical protein
MAYIENASADLGCVSIKVIEAGTNVANFDITWILENEKVLFIDVERIKNTYDLTVYYTDEEWLI